MIILDKIKVGEGIISYRLFITRYIRFSIDCFNLPTITTHLMFVVGIGLFEIGISIGMLDKINQFKV